MVLSTRRIFPALVCLALTSLSGCSSLAHFNDSSVLGFLQKVPAVAIPKSQQYY